jgi:hypothetical protein
MLTFRLFGLRYEREKDSLNSNSGDVNRRFNYWFSVVSLQFVKNSAMESPFIFKIYFSHIVAVRSHNEKEIACDPWKADQIYERTLSNSRSDREHHSIRTIASTEFQFEFNRHFLRKSYRKVTVMLLHPDRFSFKNSKRSCRGKVFNSMGIWRANFWTLLRTESESTWWPFEAIVLENEQSSERLIEREFQRFQRRRISKLKWSLTIFLSSLDGISKIKFILTGNTNVGKIQMWVLVIPQNTSKSILGHSDFTSERQATRKSVFNPIQSIITTYRPRSSNTTHSKPSTFHLKYWENRRWNCGSKSENW